MRAKDGTRWNESFPRTPSYRQVTPPQPVSINLDQALARDNPPLRTVNPLRVTAGGLRLTGYCPRPAARLGQIDYRHLAGILFLRRTQRQPPGHPRAVAMATRQRHHPTPALAATTGTWRRSTRARTAPPRHRTLWRGARRPRTPGCLRGEGGWAVTVALGGGSGWGVLLDDRQMPTSGTRVGASGEACLPPPGQPKVETAPADEENTPPNRPVRQANNVGRIPAIPLHAIPATM